VPLLYGLEEDWWTKAFTPVEHPVRSSDMFPLVQLLLLTTSACATLAHDKVYALLGLVEHTVSQHFIANYSWTVPRVFAQAAMAANCRGTNA